MKLNLWLGTDEGQLHLGMSCPEGCEPLSELQDRFVARLWLQQFRKSGARMAAIRDLLSRDLLWREPWRLTDDKLIERIAELLSIGFLHAHATHESLTPGALDQPSSDAPVEHRRIPSPRMPREVAVPEEANSLPQNADEAAIAEALKTAAANGIPFCEECMRAQLEGNRAGAAHA